MKTKNQDGFSLIEMLLVVVILGIIAALAVPSLMKAIRATDNGAAYSTLRTINSMQVAFYSQNSRFARLTELAPLTGGGLGTIAGERLIRNRFTFEMASVAEEDLRAGYIVTATKSEGGTLYEYEISESGVIEQIHP